MDGGEMSTVQLCELCDDSGPFKGEKSLKITENILTKFEKNIFPLYTFSE